MTRCVFFSYLFCLAACSSGTRAPVTTRVDQAQPSPSSEPAAATATTQPAAEHSVAAGDTLYSIAWRYGLDYRDIAAWNGIDKPYVIYPGQALRLRAPATKTATQTATKPGPVASAAAPAATKPVTKATTSPQSGPARLTAPPLSFKWRWPAQGKLLRFNSPIAKKGISIGGTIGQAIKAAAAGDVVYSGSGLRGYGKLIILKHNATFLSAYAHNSELLVKEGERVRQGQQIALMGLGNEGQALLHFEIRKNGKPVNPISQLPRQRS